MAKFRYQIWYKNLLRSPLILIIYENVQNWNVIVPILASKFKSISQSQFLRIFTIPIYKLYIMCLGQVRIPLIIRRSYWPVGLLTHFRSSSHVNFCLFQLICEGSRRKYGEIQQNVLRRTFRHAKPNPTPKRYVLIQYGQQCLDSAPLPRIQTAPPRTLPIA